MEVTCDSVPQVREHLGAETEGKDPELIHLGHEGEGSSLTVWMDWYVKICITRFILNATSLLTVLRKQKTCRVRCFEV